MQLNWPNPNQHQAETENRVFEHRCQHSPLPPFRSSTPNPNLTMSPRTCWRAVIGGILGLCSINGVRFGRAPTLSHGWRCVSPLVLLCFVQLLAILPQAASVHRKDFYTLSSMRRLILSKSGWYGMLCGKKYITVRWRNVPLKPVAMVNI